MRDRILRLTVNSAWRTPMIAYGLIWASLLATTPCGAQDLTPLARVQALDLDSAHVGRVMVYFAPRARDRAIELAQLTHSATQFAERELSLGFDVRVAALEPEHWFSEFPGVPYAIPWVSIPERLLFVQSSLSEGFMVRGPSPQHDRYRIGFGLLHEHGHLLEKAYFRPQSAEEGLPTSWFGELLANYFAYAYLHSVQPEWAEAAKGMWRAVVEGYTPSTLSLEWSFMNDLPPQELARTYAWYQNLLNLRAAALFEVHGLDLLRSLKDGLAWESTASWTTPSLLNALEHVAPGFQDWANDLTNAAYMPSER